MRGERNRHERLQGERRRRGEERIGGEGREKDRREDK